RVDELNFHTSAHAIIILVGAVEESRHIVGLNCAHVKVIAQVNIDAAAQLHSKGSVRANRIGDVVTKADAHMLKSSQSFGERIDPSQAKVITRTEEQVVALGLSTELLSV